MGNTCATDKSVAVKSQDFPNAEEWGFISFHHNNRGDVGYVAREPDAATKQGMIHGHLMVLRMKESNRDDLPITFNGITHKSSAEIEEDQPLSIADSTALSQTISSWLHEVDSKDAAATPPEPSSPIDE